MALNSIESAPKNGQFIILQDESAVVYEVARWSAEKGDWIQEEGEPIQITPTHWMPLPGASLAVSSQSLSARDGGALWQMPRLSVYAGICAIVGLAILLVASVGNFAGPRENDRTAVGETSPGVTNNSQPASSRVADRDRDNLGKLTSAAGALVAPERPSSPSSGSEEIRPPGKQIIEQEPQKAGIPRPDITLVRTQNETLKMGMAATQTETPAEPSQTAQVSAAEKQALEQERQRGEAQVRELVLVREEVEALTARVAAATAARVEAEQILQAAQASVAEQRQALEQERQRRKTLADELALARQEIEALMLRVATSAGQSEPAQILQSAQALAAEQKHALEQERRHSEALASDLASAREEVEAFKAAERAAAEAVQKAQALASEQKDALEREHQRGDALASDLASARDEVETLTTRIAAANAAHTGTAQFLQAAKASAAEQTQAVERERQRGDALLRELALAREEIEAHKVAERAAAEAVQKAQASAREQKDAIEREHQRGDALARDLVSLRDEGEALKVRVAATNAAHMEAAQSLQAARALAIEQKNALEQERQRGDALARELVSLQEEGEALKARVAAAVVASIEPTQSAEASRALPKTSSPQAAAPSSKAAFVLSAADDGRGLAAPPQTVAETKSSADSRDNVATPARRPQVASVGVGEHSITTAPPLRPIEELNALWLQRGENFVAVGDFASARMVFQRAAEAGDAQAALLLGGTYDPNVLDRFRAKGLAADIAKAHWWYEKARALGSPEALRRLDLLAQPRR